LDNHSAIAVFLSTVTRRRSPEKNRYSILAAVETLSEGNEMSDDEVALLQEQLGEARGEVERLQMAAADSEARALHLEEIGRETRSWLETVEGELASERQRSDELSGQLEGSQTELAARQEETQELHASLLAAAGKYREALLAAVPELPEELVAGETIEESEEAAERLETKDAARTRIKWYCSMALFNTLKLSKLIGVRP
jgi:chromosome segregation ATPase